MNRPDPSDELTTGTETHWFNNAGIPAPWPKTIPQN